MKGVVIDSVDDVAAKISAAGLAYFVVIKAQVQIGGRGKAGFMAGRWYGQSRE